MWEIPFPYSHEKNKLGENSISLCARKEQTGGNSISLQTEAPAAASATQVSSPRGKASLATEETPQEQLAGQD